MTLEIAHSHNVFPSQVSINLSFAGAHLGAPVFENLHGCDEDGFLGGFPGGVFLDHDGSDDTLIGIEDVPTAGLNILRHFPALKRVTVRPADAETQAYPRTSTSHIHRGCSDNSGQTPRNSVLSIGLCSYFVPHLSNEFAAPTSNPAANGVRHSSNPTSPSRTPTQSQRPISQADTAPRMNAAMSQSLHAREDLVGQSQCRRSRSDARPATLSERRAEG